MRFDKSHFGALVSAFEPRPFHRPSKLPTHKINIRYFSPINKNCDKMSARIVEFSQGLNKPGIGISNGKIFIVSFVLKNMYFHTKTQLKLKSAYLGFFTFPHHWKEIAISGHTE